MVLRTYDKFVIILMIGRNKDYFTSFILFNLTLLSVTTGNAINYFYALPQFSLTSLQIVYYLNYQLSN